jgi:hypothetical protein
MIKNGESDLRELPRETVASHNIRRKFSNNT